MSQWTLFEKDFRSIDQVLFDLIERTHAISVHLVDRSGQLITTAGRAPDFDVTAFSSLIAADFTANAELSRMMGGEGVQAVVSEGPSRTVYSCMLADRVILSVLFDRRSTLGLVRFRATRAVTALDPVFRGLLDKIGLGGTVEAPQAFADAASREVDALFGL